MKKFLISFIFAVSTRLLFSQTGISFTITEETFSSNDNKERAPIWLNTQNTLPHLNYHYDPWNSLINPTNLELIYERNFETAIWLKQN